MQVTMVLDVLRALSQCALVLGSAEVSEAAALLLTSQPMPLAAVSDLWPSQRCNSAALESWRGDGARSIDLRTMLVDVRIGTSPRLPLLDRAARVRQDRPGRPSGQVWRRALAMSG